MTTPKQIKEFIQKEILLENFCLPQFYPEEGKLLDFQVGYKTNANTGEKITGEQEGDFKESWFVICSNYASDPFFIDINQENEDFPVYFSWAGTGTWVPIKVAETISDFTNQLLLLKKWELEESESIQNKMKEHFDTNHEFWKEVCLEYTIEEE